ncbi:MAG: N-acetylmuramoyl-L-alanine amidase [Bacteroidales bacterium]|nr:N-acetylmuramoyl-L-alanine amidase [Bacteroidales bacterium]
MIAALASMAFGGSAQAQEITKQDWGNFKLWIDPGHSGRENTGLYSYTEAEKVLRVGLATRAFLFKYTTADETTIAMTRDDDQDYVTLEERSDMANAWGADFFYSIHSDAGSPSKNTTVFLFGGWKNNGQLVEKTPNGGKRMGDIMCPNLTGVMYDTDTRGNYYDRDFYISGVDTHESQYPYLSVNRRTNMASILSEGGYHTLPMQQALNMNESYKNLEAFATARSIMEYRGLARPEKVLLAGVVTNSENGQPIDGVSVTVNGKTIVTDSYETLFNKYVKNPNLVHNGFFLFEDDLTPGQEVTLTYKANGFPETTKTVTLQSNPQGLSSENVTWANVSLTSNAPAQVSGVSVTNPDAVNIRENMVFTFSRNMDRASVEQAFSISDGAQVGLSWDNDYTLRVDLNSLLDDYGYTIKIDGSIAKNSQTQQFLDGDKDGVEGGDYLFTFTTQPADEEAPYVASTTPVENSTMKYTMRPVIRVEYNEELKWNEDDVTGDEIVVSDKNGQVLSGRLTHEVVAGASVLHFYLDNDLTRDACYKVAVKGGFKDLSDNVSAPYVFKFLSEYRTVTSEGVIDATENINDWFSPGGSGSSKGFTTMEDQSMVASTFVSNPSQTSSFKIHYEFDPDTQDAYWGLRCYKKNGAKYYTDGKNAIIQAYVYGDGSQNWVGHGVRDRSDAATVKRHTKHQMNRGWEMVTFDVNHEENAIVSGEATLVAGLWQYDAFWLWRGYVSEFEDEDPDFPSQAWTGDIYFDELKYVHYGTEEQTATLEDIVITSVDDIQASNITIAAEAGAINVAAPEKIGKVFVYAMNGATVANVAPASTVANISTANLAPGAYVVKVVTNSKTEAQRILVK